MKKFRLLLMMVLTAAVSFTACDTPEKGDDVATPTVALTLEAEEVYEDAFMAFATTTDAEKAAWLVVSHGDTTVTVDGVFANGTEIPADQLNGEEPAMILVEDLEPATEYDLYVAVQNKGKKVLSEPLHVTTAEAAPQYPVVEMYFTECANALNLSQAGAPGHMFTLNNADYSAMMNIIIVDRSNAENYSYISTNFYPSVTCANGEMGMPVWPTGSGVVCNPAYSSASIYDAATDSVKDYYFVGNQGEEYGVDVITLMPDTDNNMFTFNLLATTSVDDNGNPNGELVVVQGSFTGPLGYPVAPAAIDFDLQEWGYTSFEATKEGNVVRLRKSSPQGDFVINMTTTGETMANAEGVLYTVEDENLSGYYFDPLDEVDYNFSAGGFTLTTTDTPGTYILEVGERRGWSFEGGNKVFNVVPKSYTVTITGLPETEGKNEIEDLPKEDADGGF
ncbi:MAG: hypothetical protein IJB08_04200 [Alistipes sp.]|nr:hypothetical protein [Alistipes sp.]